MQQGLFPLEKNIDSDSGLEFLWKCISYDIVKLHTCSEIVSLLIIAEQWLL